MPKILFVSSPFFCRRGNFPLDMIVIYHIGAKDGKLYGVKGTITWFTDESVHKNPSTKKIENIVSAHYIIPREQYQGSDIVQCVNDLNVAYHAGNSQWTINGQYRNNINNYSIGIELEGDGNLVNYTDYQYEQLTALVKNLTFKYNIPEQNIVGHEDVSPGRKVDPGRLFDWKRLRESLVYSPVVTTSPATVPDREFHMGSGENTPFAQPHGIFGSIFAVFLSLFMKFFNR